MQAHPHIYDGIFFVFARSLIFMLDLSHHEMHFEIIHRKRKNNKINTKKD